MLVSAMKMSAPGTKAKSKNGTVPVGRWFPITAETFRFHALFTWLLYSFGRAPSAEMVACPRNTCAALPRGELPVVVVPTVLSAVLALVPKAGAQMTQTLLMSLPDRFRRCGVFLFGPPCISGGRADKATLSDSRKIDGCMLRQRAVFIMLSCC